MEAKTRGSYLSKQKKMNVFIKFSDAVISAFEVEQTHNQLIPQECMPFVCLSELVVFAHDSVYLMRRFK